ncbi:hypothetical protein BJX70DRAFT_403879 [Aspergillus crustosus]
MSKRTIESFYKAVTPPKPKKPKTDEDSTLTYTTHPSYPHPIANLPPSIAASLANITKNKDSTPKRISDQPHLDLLYFHPLIPSPTARELFDFLRRELPFYRVKYSIRRGAQTTQISTPRFTTVFGVDETSLFLPASASAEAGSKDDVKLEDTSDTSLALAPSTSTLATSSTTTTTTSTLALKDPRTHTPTPPTKYKHTPRPIPPCLDALRQAVQSAIGDSSSIYNFCLVNYYATGDDSISYHSDDERFLGRNPSIASISLGAQRDFLMRHKPSKDAAVSFDNTPMKFALASGDMVVMRGETQANWLHSIPKRKGKGGEASRGRINITFRKAVVPGGTENYYTYNVGSGGVYRWDEGRGEMCAVNGEESNV